MRKKRKGFTLVELMVVIAIMAILAAAATPVFTGYVKKARATGHLSECRAIYVAVCTFLEEERAGGSFEADDIDMEELIGEIKSLTGIDSVNGIPGKADTKELSDDYSVCLEDGEDGVICTAVIYNGGGDGVWIFDTAEGTFREADQ